MTAHRHVHTYEFHHGDVNKDTIKDYSSTIAGCLALLVCSHRGLTSDYLIPMPDDFGPLCDGLVQALGQHSDIPEDEEIPDAHKLEIDPNDEELAEEEAPPQVIPASPLTQICRHQVQAMLRKLLIAIYTQFPMQMIKGQCYSVLVWYLALAAHQ